MGACEEVWAPPDVSLEFTRGFCSLWKCWAFAPTAKPVAQVGDTASMFPAPERHVSGPPCFFQMRHDQVCRGSPEDPVPREGIAPRGCPSPELCADAEPTVEGFLLLWASPGLSSHSDLASFPSRLLVVPSVP